MHAIQYLVARPLLEMITLPQNFLVRPNNYYSEEITHAENLTPSPLAGCCTISVGDDKL